YTASWCTRHLHSFPTRRSSDLAFEVDSGEMLWQTGITPDAKQIGILGGSLVGDDDNLYVVDLENDIQKLDRATGDVVDTFTIARDRKSTRLNSSHVSISYAVFC